MSNIKEVIINPNKPASVKFVQYDTGQKLYVKNSPDFDFTNTTEIQITNGTESASRYRFEPYGDGGIVELPDTMFQTAGILKGYIFSVDPHGHTTEALISIGIRERAVYNEYISDASEEVVIPAGFEVIQNEDSVTIKATNTDGTVTEGTVENGSDGEPGAPGLPGSDGISPEVSVEQTATGAVITVTDARGTTTATLENGHDGDDGISPTARVEQITGGARVTVTDRNGTTTATIANGQPGQPGSRGQDGTSPSINVDTIEGGHRLTITDESHGTQYVDVMDGERGRQGDQGERGDRGLPGVDGVSPTAKVTQTETGATITVTDGDGTTTANLTNGRDGDPGVDGISPTATVEQTETGARVTITDKNGTTTANLTNGAAGSPGAQGLPGVDGYSPIATVTQTDDGAEISITDRNGTTEAVIRNGAQGEAGTDGVSPSIVIDDIPGGHRLKIYDEQHGYQYVDVLDGHTIGVPFGGQTGQILKKVSDADFDTEWADEEGGVVDYPDLTNKPQINGNTLIGNKTGAELGLTELVELTQAEYDALTDIDPNKAYFINDADPAALGTAAFKDYTDRVRPGDTGLVMSHVVYSAISSAISSIYTPRGNIDCADLTSSLLVDANIGSVYETNDSGTTSELFVQGAGKTINAGDNVGIIRTGVDTILFNLMGNAFDLTDYQKKDLTTETEGQTTVEGAIGALATNKQEKTLTTPVESRTTVEDALGALSTNKAAKSEMSVTDGTGVDADKTTIQLKSGTSATVLKTHQDISGKADKVTGATNGNFAGLDANGNLTDSGKKASDFASSDIVTTLANYINENGAINQFDMTLSNTKSVNTGGTWNSNAYTYRGLTYTVNTDNIVITGTPTDNSFFYLLAKNIPAGRYTFGGLKDAANIIWDGGFWIYDGSVATAISTGAEGTKADFTIDLSSYTFDRIKFGIKRKSNTLTNDTVKLFIRKADVNIDVDAPYAKTNRELTVETEALSTNKQPKTLSAAISIGGTNRTTVETALGALNDWKVSTLSRLTSFDDQSGDIYAFLDKCVEIGVLKKNVQMSFVLTQLYDHNFLWTFTDLNNFQAGRCTIKFNGYYSVNSADNTANSFSLEIISWVNHVIYYYLEDRPNYGGPHAWRTVSTNPYYSTSEVFTGQYWIDGKPIYRKVYTGLSFGAQSPSWQSFSVAPPSNVGLLIYSKIIRSDRTACEGVAIKLNTSDNVIQYLNTMFNATTNDITLIIEYTKTTD